ncbi:hypothetical protein SDC9_95544 [bioreactor metagenome]|uniref:HTH cro/C1-type domain-containing protein n=1 Tax=bioreactor metagenome TaxID=1076179 RepID=A0A645A6X8_9ZZZZ
MKEKANPEIRKLMKEKSIYQWQVAVELGITDATFVRWLRLPLEDEKKNRVLKAIEEAATQNV